MEFKLPDIGEGVHEGEITKWLVKPGDKIQADQPMVEVMTDKATVEIPSPVTGTVEKLHAKEGETLEVGKTLLTIAEAGKTAAPAAPKAEKPAAPAQAAAKAPAKQAPESTRQATLEMHKPPHEELGTRMPPPPAPAEEPLPFEILATPATRKLARDLEVDLRHVRGSGPHGRITKDDVQRAHESGGARTAPKLASGMPAMRGPQAPPAPMVFTGETKRIPLKGIRKRIAESMSRSKHTAAHFTYVEEVDMTAIVNLRKQAAKDAEARGVKLTFLPFIIKAVCPALREFPYLNASLDDAAQEIVLKGDYNIGIATDTPQGLMVPVIKQADKKSLWDLAGEITQLSERARTGKSTIDDLKGGTFTLTNAGSIGGVFATPVINHPEVAILGVNAIRKRPWVVNGEIVIRDIMFLSLSVDHRVVDGADAARFMNRLIYFLSEPTRLVFA